MSRARSGYCTFSAAELVLLHHAVRDLIVRHTLGNRPVPPGFDPLHAKLVSFVDETKTCAGQTDSASSAEEELVDTAQAATILNCSPQWVGKIRHTLGVREIGSQRVFPRQNVVDYAARKASQNR